MDKPKPCDENCPKCGSDDVSRKFRARDAAVENESYGRCDNRFSTGQCQSFRAFRDHIDQHCRCCHYRWQVLPLPKKKTGGKNAR